MLCRIAAGGCGGGFVDNAGAGALAATGQRGLGRGVVRLPIRRAHHQPSAVQESGDAVDHADLQRLARGQIGQDLDTSESVGIGDVEAQAEQAMANIDMLLGEAGSRMDHLVKLTIYLVDPRYRETVYRTVGRWTKGVHPISTGVVVSALARPEWLCEIDAIAVIPEDDR